MNLPRLPVASAIWDTRGDLQGPEPLCVGISRRREWWRE